MEERPSETVVLIRSFLERIPEGVRNKKFALSCSAIRFWLPNCDGEAQRSRERPLQSGRDSLRRESVKTFAMVLVNRCLSAMRPPPSGRVGQRLGNPFEVSRDQSLAPNAKKA